MKIRIPNNELIKTHDAVLEIAKQFPVELQSSDDAIIVTANEQDMCDFLTAYNDLDIDAAKNDMDKYADRRAIATFTPESALQRINDFVLSKGAFEGYDAAFEAIYNAIHGINID